MKKSLSHLPKHKQDELELIKDIVLEKIPDVRMLVIDARYKKDYKITKKQLEYLAERVKKLQKITKTVCKEKIESYA